MISLGVFLISGGGTLNEDYWPGLIPTLHINNW